VTKDAEKIRKLRCRVEFLERQLSEVQARLNQEILGRRLLDAKFAGYVAAVQQLAPYTSMPKGVPDAPAT
jgi:hypothetical protein